MVIGAAGELPKPPETPVVFLEGMSPLVCSFITHELMNMTLDMDESEMAQVVCQ